MTVKRLAIHGAAGRMGKRLVALGSAGDDLQVTAALEFAGHPDLGKDAGLVAGVDAIGTLLTDNLQTQVDVVIDFSVAEAVDQITAICVQQRIPLVMATTGLTDQQVQRVREASQQVPIVMAPNMSLAVNLTMRLAETAGRVLKDYSTGADVEIIESHHRFKEDAPSGTALRFGEIIANTMGQTRHVHGREGRPGPRGRDEIGYHALRTGDNPGEHTIVFGLLGETIEITCRATSRDCYAAGALQAAKFVASKPAGLYTMFDVLGL